MVGLRGLLVALVILSTLGLTGTSALPSSRDSMTTGSVTVSVGASQFFNGAFHSVLNITNVDSAQPVEVLVLNSTTGVPLYNYDTGNSGWIAYLNGTVLTYETYDGNHIHYGISRGDSMAILIVLALNTGFQVDWSAFTKQGDGANERYMLLDQGTITL